VRCGVAWLGACERWGEGMGDDGDVILGCIPIPLAFDLHCSNKEQSHSTISFTLDCNYAT
jgi:hypothetical protein